MAYVVVAKNQERNELVVGYDEAAIERVKALLRKEKLKRDADVQCLDDVICLVFLESYLAGFATQQDEDKLVTILQRTWKKMSARGHDAALKLDFPPEMRRVLDRCADGVRRSRVLVARGQDHDTVAHVILYPF